MNTWVNSWMAEHGVILPSAAYADLCRAIERGTEPAPSDATLTVLYRRGNNTHKIKGPTLADLVRNAHAVARLNPGGTLGPLTIERPVCLPRFVGPYVHAPKSFDTMEGNRKWSADLANWRKEIEADREAWELLK